MCRKRMMWKVPSCPEAVGEMRATLRKVLAEWEILDDAEDNILIASELITNAIVHGSPEIRLTLAAVDGHVLGAVADQGSEMPRVRPPDELAVSGRGLRLVADLAGRWGIQPRPAGDGKTLWWQWP